MLPLSDKYKMKSSLNPLAYIWRDLQSVASYLYYIILISLVMSSCGKDLTIYETAKTYELNELTINGEKVIELRGIVNDTLKIKSGQYLINEGLIVNEDGRLYIPAGTVLYFENDATNMLVIERGGKLFVEGSAAQPVVMTSVSELYGSLPTGNWGGVHINGNAALNDRNETLTEIIGNYGKTSNAEDGESSGSLQYLRIQYAGAPQRNIGGALNLNGAGSGTLLDHIQIYRSISHGIRMRGGAVSVRQLLISQSTGTSLRWEAGWRGKIQQLVIHQEETVADTLTFIRGESGGTRETPYSSPKISNFTIVGKGDNTRGIRLEDQTRCLLINGIIAHTERAIRTDALDSLILNGTVKLGNTVLFDNKINFYDHENGKTSLLNTPQNAWYKGDIGLNGYTGSRANGALDAKTADSWFTSLIYMGGVENAAEDWTLLWTKK